MKGAGHDRDPEECDRRDRYRYRQELVSRRRPGWTWGSRAAAEVVAWPGGDTLDLRLRHPSGRQFEEDDQAAFAGPVRGPVHENCSVERNAPHRGYRRGGVATRPEPTMAQGALYAALSAIHLSTVLVPGPKPVSPHRRIGGNRRDDGRAQS